MYFLLAEFAIAIGTLKYAFNFYRDTNDKRIELIKEMSSLKHSHSIEIAELTKQVHRLNKSIGTCESIVSSVNDARDGVQKLTDQVVNAITDTVAYGYSFIPPVSNWANVSISSFVPSVPSFTNVTFPDVYNITESLKQSVDGAIKSAEELCTSENGARICSPQMLGLFALTAVGAATAGLAWKAYKGRAETKQGEKPKNQQNQPIVKAYLLHGGSPKPLPVLLNCLASKGMQRPNNMPSPKGPRVTVL